MEVVDVVYTGPGEQYQRYSLQDISLINTALINGTFGNSNDYVEYFVKDLNGSILDANYFNTQYKIGSIVNPVNGNTNQLFLDPESDARNLGYDRGIFNVKYNFLTTHLLSTPTPNQNFWIKEISPSRTEIKVARQDLSNSQLADTFNTFNTVLTADAYYPTFYLNFGGDDLVIGINAVYVEEGGVGYIIFKLYEPLPDDFDIKSTFWVVTQAANSAEFNVTINIAAEAVSDTQRIKGPNFKVTVAEKVGQTTPYYSYNSLFATSVTSSYQQLQSIMQDKGILINTDYTDLNNFIHFSSATERLYNFVYKLQLIESASLGLTQTNTVSAKVTLQSQIDSTIKNFDGWEYYLYYTSESTAWPKQNSTSPYGLYSVTSSQAVNWLGSINTVPAPGIMSMYWSSSNYDNTNKDWLVYATPGFISEDSQNAPYLTFLNMIGQHFDNIWIYYKDVTNHYSAENNPFVGISMDQVADALRSFGVQLYTNTSVTDNLYYSLLGINQTGSAFPVTSSLYSTVVPSSSSIYPLSGEDYLTASLYLPPFGEEKINRYVITFITGSPTTSSFQTLPDAQLTGEIYKRLYHNLAYLLKTRGTERGVKALIATYGVPADILTVHEYGGYNYLEVPGIQEISNTRILTGSVLQISSSLLSPNTTLQYYSNDLENTSITVQAGFSPADSINAAITSSGYVTSSTQPGYFNIMQLIGDPALQYTETYTPLEKVSNAFFTNTFSERNNVWDFIRIIKYYNNSLFKMLRDWVPARSSADTGIVVKSHMLERNKYPRKEPTWSTASYTASIDMVSISGSDGGAVIGSTNFIQTVPIQYSGTASIALTASLGYVNVSQSYGWPQYTGEFDGTTIVASTNYFPQEEVSSYLYPWTSSAYGGGPLFLTYSLSALYQNVNVPVRSQRFYDLDFGTTQFAPTNYGLITQSMQETLLIGNVSQSEQPYSQYAYIQDFNYYSRAYTIPRYSGSYLSGQAYNEYTTGDTSYGNDPVINWYSDKLGLFVQVASSSFFPGKVNVSLAYLADVSGGLFELNQNNRNWVDIQNIFEGGTTLTVKQFDNKKYSNQVSTDGVKTIYNSGYNYTPQLYFTSESDQRLYFKFLSQSVDTGVRLYNSGSPNNYISGIVSPRYYPSFTGPVGTIYGLFDSGSNLSNTSLGFWTLGNPGSANAAFEAYQAGPYTFTYNFDLTTVFPDPTVAVSNIDYVASLALNGNLIDNFNVQNYQSVYTPGTVFPGEIFIKDQLAAGSLSSFVQQGSAQIVNGPWTLYYPDNQQEAIGSPTSSISVALFNYNRVGYPLQTDYFILSASADLAPNPLFISGSSTPTILYDYATQGNSNPDTIIDTVTKTFSYNSQPVLLNIGDTVEFNFYVDIANNYFPDSYNFTSSVSYGLANSVLKVAPSSLNVGGYPYATSSIGYYIDSISDITALESDIVLNADVSQFYQYQFIPAFVSGGLAYTSSLYNVYGDVNVPFNPQLGDKIVLADDTGIYQELDVRTAELIPSASGDYLHIRVVPQVLPNWVSDPKLIKTFLLLNRYNDEQNIILNLIQAPGQTSYGFIIPETITPQVLDNINTLQASVQSQILTQQTAPPIDTIYGGSFQ